MATKTPNVAPTFSMTRTEDGQAFWFLRVPGGGSIAWNGKPWVPGQTSARFLTEMDARHFAAAQGLTCTPHVSEISAEETVNWTQAKAAAVRAWDAATDTNIASATHMLRRACEVKDLAKARDALVGAETAGRKARKWTGAYRQAVRDCAKALGD